jgi:hypothetical protein
MGLLDEAIKEHLELKRRHGADPGEVARLEHEALGPARREPVAEEPVVEEAVGEEPVADEEPVAEVAPPPEAPPPPAAEPSPIDDDYADEVTADERLESPARPVAPPPEADAEQPTAQYTLEELEEAADDEEAAEPEGTQEPNADVVPADEEPESDDVLEETPDFLQETPEHDRLWFEQKPPRDFDF